MGDNPEIVITSIGGNLRVTGWDGNEFHAKSEDDTLTTEQQNGSLALTSQSDCAVRLPRRARLKILQVSGDARIESLDGHAKVESIGGNLILRQTATIKANHIGGDLHAKQINGSLAVKSVGGDLSAQGIKGEVIAEQVGSNLHLREVNMHTHARTGGDALLYVEATSQAEFDIEAGGDIRCRIPANTSARFTLQAGGESIVNLPGAQIENNAGQKVVTLKDGASQFNLRAQGDIALISLSAESEMGANFGERWGDEFGQMAENLAEQIESQIEAQMGQFEKQLTARLSRLDHLGATLSNVKGLRMEAMTQRAHQAAERAGEAARRRAERLPRGGFAWNFDFPGPGETPAAPAAEPVSNEERLSILRMLEQKKITAVEAEQLLSALEGR